MQGDNRLVRGPIEMELTIERQESCDRTNQTGKPPMVFAIITSVVFTFKDTLVPHITRRVPGAPAYGGVPDSWK